MWKERIMAKFTGFKIGDVVMFKPSIVLHPHWHYLVGIVVLDGARLAVKYDESFVPLPAAPGELELLERPKQ